MGEKAADELEWMESHDSGCLWVYGVSVSERDTVGIGC